MSPRLAVLTISILLALAPTPLRAGEPAPADAHAEMAAALEQQADLVPTPPLLIGERAVPPRREPPARNAGSQGSAERDAHARSGSETRQLSTSRAEAAKSAASEARQARTAAESAARQDESKRAKDRAAQHPETHP
jgi:hypothetical protein